MIGCNCIILHYAVQNNNNGSIIIILWSYLKISPYTIFQAAKLHITFEFSNKVFKKHKGGQCF